MNNNNNQNELNNVGGDAQISEFTLYVDDREALSMPGHTKVRELLDVILGQGEVGFVFVEEIVDPLGESLTLVEAGVVHESQLHVGRCRHVGVSVRYEAKTETKTFAASATIAAVKRWAVTHFHVADPADHQLALPGAKEPPKEDVRVGRLASGHECTVCLDLRLFPRVQG